MPRKDPTSCSRILETAALPLVERARRLLRLEQSVLETLPQDLASHCKVLNFKQQTLVLATPSSAWGARLRFAAPELVRTLRTRLSLNVNAIEVRIRPETPPACPPGRTQPKLSMESGTLLAQTAQEVEHRGLQEALYRLAANARDF